MAAPTKFKVTDTISDFLFENRIFFSLDERRAKLGRDEVIAVPNDLSVERYVTFNRGRLLFDMKAHSYSNSQLPAGISVGRYCSIASDVVVAGFAHPMTGLTTGLLAYDRTAWQMKAVLVDEGIEQLPFVLPPRKSMPVIENDVWLGSNVWLARGITIGTGSIIAANAVLTKSVPPYQIWGGNPAVLIRKRFPDALAEALLASNWWRLSVKDLATFPFDDAESFISAYREQRGDDLAPWLPDKIDVAGELAKLT